MDTSLETSFNDNTKKQVDDQFRAMYEARQRADYDTSQVVCATYASVPSSSQWQTTAIAACWVGPESCRQTTTDLIIDDNLIGIHRD